MWKIIEYILAIGIGSIICFCFLFPMLGRKIIEFERKIQVMRNQEEN